MEKISVIVPVYKAEKWLQRCVDSILGQTYANIEVLLVDDGSPDTSGKICDEYAEQDSRVRVVHKPNGGVSSARNAGLEMATGEYVVFVDSDDRLRSDFCELMLGKLKEYDADCVICGVKQDNGIEWKPSQERFYKDMNDFRQNMPSLLDSELLSIPFNKIYRRELITKKFREDMGFGEDLVFSLEYLDNCRNVVFISDMPYLHNNLNECSIVHNFNPKRLQDIESFEKRILSFYGNDNDGDINAKYVRDIANHLFDLISQPDISLSEKKEVIKAWYKSSKLKSLRTMPFSRMHWKKKLLIHALRHGYIMTYSRLVMLKQRLR